MGPNDAEQRIVDSLGLSTPPDLGDLSPAAASRTTGAPLPRDVCVDLARLLAEGV